MRPDGEVLILASNADVLGFFVDEQEAVIVYRVVSHSDLYIVRSRREFWSITETQERRHDAAA